MVIDSSHLYSKEESAKVVSSLLVAMNTPLALFPPNPQARRKERSHGRLGKFKVLAEREFLSLYVIEFAKSILPISVARKQIVGFFYQYATKFLYRIPGRFVKKKNEKW
ncbi:MAG: hypothetical protein IKY72_02330 [Bacteroidaceae bacterium]|nr:hypothetical protein [Bacteroidaceae bacterium]